MPESSVEANYRTAANDNGRLEIQLQAALGLTQPEIGEGVRCYTTLRNPSQQMKNKLSQAVSRCRDGLLHLRVADEASHDLALAALRDRWENNPEWPKLAAVALAYPDERGNLTLASVVVHSQRPFLDALRSAFPAARVYFTLGASSELPRAELGNTERLCGHRLAIAAGLTATRLCGW
jgi:hypothetical protein